MITIGNCILQSKLVLNSKLATESPEQSKNNILRNFTVNTLCKKNIYIYIYKKQSSLCKKYIYYDDFEIKKNKGHITNLNL